MNACKFNKMDGKIKVTISAHNMKEERKEQRIKLTTEIEDNGEGMTRAQKKKLFKVFHSIRKNYASNPSLQNLQN